MTASEVEESEVGPILVGVGGESSSGDGAAASVSRDCVLSLDVGTTTIKCCIFDSKGSTLSRTTIPIKTDFPKTGWVEIDPSQLWADIKEAMTSALKGLW